MRCKKIQELLKTDYLDGVVDLARKVLIQQHLAQCSDCRAIEKDLISQRDLLKSVKDNPVPDQIWRNIRQAIVDERLAQSNKASFEFLSWIGKIIFPPRPIFVLASAFTMVIFILAAVFFYKQQASKIILAEGIGGYEFSEDNSDFIYDLGTNIETYFL
jgi:predicted anti-sigma-YlaC factor YlaD